MSESARNPDQSGFLGQGIGQHWWWLLWENRRSDRSDFLGQGIGLHCEANWLWNLGVRSIGLGGRSIGLPGFQPAMQGCQHSALSRISFARTPYSSQQLCSSNMAANISSSIFTCFDPHQCFFTSFVLSSLGQERMEDRMKLSLGISISEYTERGIFQHPKICL